MKQTPCSAGGVKSRRPPTATPTPKLPIPLCGRRSEVKDAHDRYANIEVAYLLQRMEAYEGLAILTTNMRQNLDAAFLRRLRFIIEFPRPDVEAREKIWRLCLPADSHELDDAAFRQLARKIDLT